MESPSVDFLVDTISGVSAVVSVLDTETPGLGNPYGSHLAGDYIVVLWVPDVIRYAGGHYTCHMNWLSIFWEGITRGYLSYMLNKEGNG